MKLQDSMGYLINVSAKLIKRDLDNQLKAFQLTTTQWSVLKVLQDSGELTQVEITEKLNSDQATCGAMVDRMVKRELLQRKAHEGDRRAYKVSLTEKSRGIMEELEKMAWSSNEHALKGISEEDRERLIQLLQQMISNLKEG